MSLFKTPLPIFSITLILLFTGCAHSVGPSGKQPSVIMPIIDVSTAIEVSPADFLEIQTKLNQGKSIIEVKNTPPFQLPPGILKEQPWAYFRLDGIYFAVYIRHNSNFFGGILNEAVQSGILWARKGDTQWHDFFIIHDRNEENKDTEYVKPQDQNNILYLWAQNKKMQIIAQDVHGGGSGEGIGKIMSSADGGKTWHVDRCFSMVMGGKDSPTSTISATARQFMFQNYINRKLDKGAPWDKKDFDVNSSTGRFEITQFNKELGKDETIAVDDCQNILLP